MIKLHIGLVIQDETLDIEDSYKIKTIINKLEDSFTGTKIEQPYSVIKKIHICLL